MSSVRVGGGKGGNIDVHFFWINDVLDFLSRSGYERDIRTVRTSNSFDTSKKKFFVIHFSPTKNIENRKQLIFSVSNSIF